MFNNCKDCLFYNGYRDKMEQQIYDEYDDSHTPPHFCVRFNNGIPFDVWDGKTKCRRYVKNRNK